MPWIDKEKCIGCGICIKICPVGAIRLKNNKAEVRQDKCIKCGKWVGICPNDAIRPNSENPELRGRLRRR